MRDKVKFIATPKDKQQANCVHYPNPSSNVTSGLLLSPPPPPPCPEQRRLGAISLKQTLQRTFAVSSADSFFLLLYFFLFLWLIVVTLV